MSVYLDNDDVSTKLKLDTAFMNGGDETILPHEIVSQGPVSVHSAPSVVRFCDARAISAPFGLTLESIAPGKYGRVRIFPLPITKGSLSAFMLVGPTNVSGTRVQAVNGGVADFRMGRKGRPIGVARNPQLQAQLVMVDLDDWIPSELHGWA